MPNLSTWPAPRAHPRVRSQHRAPRWSDRRLRGHPLGSGGSTCTLWHEQDVLWPAPVAHPAVPRAKRVACPSMRTRSPRSTRAAHTSACLDQGGEAQEQCEDEDLRHQLHGHLLQHARAPACVREGQTQGECEKRECERCERRISSRGECMGRSGGMYTDGGRHARAWE
jgi:hypothetical protein